MIVIRQLVISVQTSLNVLDILGADKQSARIVGYMETTTPHYDTDVKQDIRKRIPKKQ